MPATWQLEPLWPKSTIIRSTTLSHTIARLFIKLSATKVLHKESVWLYHLKSNTSAPLSTANFTVETDHSSLCWLQKMNDPNGRLARWAPKLQHHDFSIFHRAGAIRQNADGLSCSNLIKYIAPEEDWFVILLAASTYGIWRLLKSKSAFTSCLTAPRYKMTFFKSKWLLWLSYVHSSSWTNLLWKAMYRSAIGVWRRHMNGWNPVVIMMEW